MKTNRSLLCVALCALVCSFAVLGFAADKHDASAWAIQVEPVQAEAGQLPADFSMAIYEDLLARLEKSNRFQHVYRSGDHEAKNIPNLLVLHMTLLNFEQGNETERAVTTVKGSTKVQVRLKVAPRDGAPLVEKDVQGTVRFFGENLKATDALAKRIAKTLREAPLPAPGTAKAAGQ